MDNDKATDNAESAVNSGGSDMFSYEDIEEVPSQSVHSAQLSVHDADLNTGPNLPSVINLRKSDEQETIFLNCLARIHKTTPNAISYHYEGCWKIYTINGAQIFKDRR